MNRRNFLRRSAGVVSASVLPVSLVEMAFAEPAQNFSFAFISDAHLQQMPGGAFLSHLDQSLSQAIDGTTRLGREPDFVVFGGDLAQSGTRAELEHGAELLSRLRRKTYMVVGEHDYYRDFGEEWSRLFGPQHYSFNHKGVHFVVLNSVLTHDAWTHRAWPSAQARQQAMSGLSNPDNSPFMVGAAQRAWLAADLAPVDSRTPVVVLSHAPLQKMHRAWNFWTEDADEVQALLARFEQSTVIHGHVHQVQYNRIGNTRFHSVAGTSWPWPFPQACHRPEDLLPKLTVPLNRGEGSMERDATGWQLIDMARGDASVSYRLSGNRERTVALARGAAHVKDRLTIMRA